MTDHEIATRLVRIAKSLTESDKSRHRKADAGDVPMYFNPSDFVERPDKKMMPHEQWGPVEDMIQNAIYDSYRQVRPIMLKAMKRHERDIKSLGLRLKKK